MQESELFFPLFTTFILLGVIERVKRTFYKAKNGKIYFKRSFPVLFITYLLCIFSAIFEYLILRRELRFTVTFLGCVMYLSGMILRNSAIKTLGDQWSIHIDLKKTRGIVRRGPYRYIRHPYYIAVLFELGGFSLIPNSYYTTFLVLGTQLPLVFLRIYYEEKYVS